MAANAPAAINGAIASTARRHPGTATWQTVTNSVAPAKATSVPVATAGQLIHPRNSPVTAAHFTSLLNYKEVTTVTCPKRMGNGRCQLGRAPRPETTETGP